MKFRSLNPRQAGFTLIEILVVVVIMGIVVGLISINLMPDDKRTLTMEGQKLSLLLEQAHDEAIVTGKDIAWSAKGDEYRFWQKDDQGQWAEMKGDDLFQARKLAQGVRLADLKINMAKASPDERLVFSSDGLGAPFSMDLGLNDLHVRVTGDGAGKITLQNDE